MGVTCRSAASWMGVKVLPRWSRTGCLPFPICGAADGAVIKLWALVINGVCFYCGAFIGRSYGACWCLLSWIDSQFLPQRIVCKFEGSAHIFSHIGTVVKAVFDIALTFPKAYRICLELVQYLYPSSCEWKLANPIPDKSPRSWLVTTSC